MSTSRPTDDHLNSSDRAALRMGLVAALTVVLWQFPFGALILYPFSILGTWFHEMGHGLTALMLGGEFRSLQVFSNGSGLANVTYGEGVLGTRIAGALISAGGLLGPAIFGSGFILLSRNLKSATVGMYSLAILMLLSVLVWIRTGLGVLLIGGIALGLLALAIKSTPRVLQVATQFLGTIAWVSTYRQLGYLFSRNASIGGVEMLSDTGNIEDKLFLPYWFWGTLIAAVSAALLIVSFKAAYGQRR